MLSRGGDLIVLSGEMGAGKTAFAQGFGSALGITEPITSPTFTLVHSYDLPTGVHGAEVLHHADLYRLERTTEVADLALEELADDDGIVLVEWGDVVEALFGDHLDVHLESRTPTTSTPPTTTCSRPGRRHRDLRRRTVVGRSVESSRRSLRGVLVLILGIETATERVSVAVGGHEGVIGLFEVTKGRRHVETLVPAIEFMLKQAGIDLDEISVVAVDVGPGLFTGMRVGLAVAKAIAQALASADDRDLVARPPGLPVPSHRPRGRAGDRRSQG